MDEDLRKILLSMEQRITRLEMDDIQNKKENMRLLELMIEGAQINLNNMFRQLGYSPKDNKEL
jgi:hypothetical protein